jgi:hypothetical protein
MAQWSETLEPYIKVTERIKTMNTNPTAGEDLIIGAVIISDAGPSEPTLITSQSEFKQYYASKELTEDYMNELGELFEEDSSIPAIMWSNAYRLSGSNTMLIVRATKTKGAYWIKPLDGSTGEYILKDGEILKKVDGGFSITLDITEKDPTWSINIGSIGVIGNTYDTGGKFEALYDYRADTIPELVEKLLEAPDFYSTDYTYQNVAVYKEDNTTKTFTTSGTEDIDITTASEDKKKTINSVYFKEVYAGSNFIDDSLITTNADGTQDLSGFIHNILISTKGSSSSSQETYEYNTSDKRFNVTKSTSSTSTGGTLTIVTEDQVLSNFEAIGGDVDVKYYAINSYNSSSNLKVRIRRFNRGSTVEETIDAQTSLGSTTPSQYSLISSVMSAESLPDTESDFYEFAIYDTSVSDNVLYYNVGNYSSRGDISVSDLNDITSMIQFNLPSDLSELGIPYSGFSSDNESEYKTTISISNYDFTKTYVYVDDEDEFKANYDSNTYVNLYKSNDTSILGYVKVLLKENNGKGFYRYYNTTKESTNGDGGYTTDSSSVSTFHLKYKSTNEVISLKIDNGETSILKVTSEDLINSLDELSNNDIYTVEGLTDLGNTTLSYQTALAKLAVNENYFYPISTVNSSNYLVLANKASKISQDSAKLYMLAPWDIDTSTLGWKYYASPSVLYWETVARNRGNNQEFRSCFGQIGGIVSYQQPVTEFNKKTRQLLLTKKINTALWNNTTQAWNINDNYTKQSTDNILSDEANSRLFIRISKAQPTLLKQYIGRRITENLCSEIVDTISYWFNNTILTMEYNIDDFKVFCEYDEALARKNKVKVVINVRFQRALKYIEVYNNAFDVGADISSAE